MDTPDSEATEVAKITTEQNAAKRDKSKISFVYNHLKAATGLIEKLHSNAGTSCNQKQLAGWMNQSATGGTFRSILGAARSFGLVETQSGGKVLLTELGHKVIDDAERPNALVDAFLNVPLHLVLFQEYEGNVLPPPAAIERQMVESHGVPPKQKERARQTFTKSADFAGFINPDSGRLIRPASVSVSPELPESNLPNNNGGGDDGGINLDPLLVALLRKIPPVDKEWPQEPRARWFRTFAMNVSQIYDTGDEVVDLVIKIQKNEDPELVRTTE